MTQTENIDMLAAALCRAQAAGLIAAENATNTHLGKSYADLAAVWDAVRKPLADNGLSITQHPGAVRFTDERAIVTISGMLMHTSGQWQRSEMDVVVPLQQKGLNPAQILGLCIAYGRRYQLAAMCGVVTADEQDADSARMIPQEKAAGTTYAPAGRWPDYIADKWKQEPLPGDESRTLGDLDRTELREVRLREWKTNPAVQASVADEAAVWVAELGLTYGGVPKAGPGWPDRVEDLTPEQLRRYFTAVKNLKPAAE